MRVCHICDGCKTAKVFASISNGLIPFLLFTLYKYCGFRFQFQKVNSILAKLLILNKTAESIPPILADPMTEFGEIIFEMFDLKVIQIVLTVMALSLTCY